MVAYHKGGGFITNFFAVACRMGGALQPVGNSECSLREIGYHGLGEGGGGEGGGGDERVPGR